MEKQEELNRDDLGNSSDDSIDTFYESTPNNRELASYVQRPFQHPVLSDIPEESIESTSSKNVENEKIENPTTSGSAVKLNENKKKTDDNDGGIDETSQFIPSKPYSRTRSRFFHDLFPEVTPEEESDTSYDNDDDLFGLNRSKTDKASYEQKFATPDTISLSESQNIGNVSDTAKKSNKNMMKIPKQISEITADFVRLNISKTGATATAHFADGFSTPDTLLSSRSENYSDKTLRNENSEKGDCVGQGNISNQENETSEEETPRANVVDVPTENQRWQNVISNEMTGENLSNVTPIELPSSSHDENPPVNVCTNSQPHINDNASQISTGDHKAAQRLTELKIICNSLHTQILKKRVRTRNKRVQVRSLSENNLYVQSVHETQSSRYSSQATLVQGNSRSNSETRLELDLSQEPYEIILPQVQNVPPINTRIKSKHTGPRNKKKSKSAQKVNKKSKSERNTAQYNSESALDSNITQTCSESEEQYETESSSSEQRNLNERISRSRRKKWLFIEELLKNRPKKILAKCPKYLEMKSQVKVLQLEKERLEKLVIEIQKNTEDEIKKFEITKQNLLEYHKNLQDQLGERLERETGEIKKSFEHNINALQTEAELQRNKHHEEISELKKKYEKKAELKQNKHQEEISELKKMYEETVTTLQSTHIQNIEKLKEQYSLHLESARGIGVSDNSVPVNEENNANSGSIAAMAEQIAELRDQMMEKWNAEQQKREIKLALREDKLAKDIAEFEIEQQNYNNTKEHIMATMNEMELKLVATIKESNDQYWRIHSEISRLNNYKKYLDYEFHKKTTNMKNEEKRLERLQLTSFQEIQKKMEEFNVARYSMVKEQEQLDSERQALMANDPYFSRGRFEAESIFKLAGQTMDQIRKERQRLIREQSENEQLRHFLREREANIEKKEEEVEDCQEKARKQMRDANEIKKKATQEIKDYSILKEQMAIYGDRITAEKKVLHLEFQKLLDDRLEFSKEKHEFEKFKGRCWWCRLVTPEKETPPKANESDILAQLGLGRLSQIGTLEPLPKFLLPSDKPKPFNFNVKPQANNVKPEANNVKPQAKNVNLQANNVSLSVVTAPVASTPATLPHSSNDSSVISNFRDREVRTARKRAHKRERR